MLAERIQKLLEVNNMNVSDLARYCSVTPQAAHKWVNGAQPRSDRKTAIADFFKITVQELEYGSLPMLTLMPMGETTALSGKLDIQASKRAANLIISNEINECGIKSTEYQQGMSDRIVFHFSNIQTEIPFAAGTCQADAYNAGIVHAEKLLGKMQF